MDPFFEWRNRWLDFHTAFVNELSDLLLNVLPKGYDAPIQEQINIIDREGDEPAGIYADAAVVESEMSPRMARPSGGTATLGRPVTLPLSATEPEPHPWVEVRTLEGDERVVTIIEVLSPTNKRGRRAAEFAAKRSAALRRGVNWVEIDLLLAGRRIELGRPLPEGDYYAHVVREARPGEADVYAWALAEPLPAVPVPLLPADGEVVLDLPAVFAATHERRQYARRLDYAGDVPRADAGHVAWARGVLAAAGPA